MIQNVTATGTKLTLYSDLTYPQGITIATLPAGTDPLDSPAMTFAEYQTGPNGDLIVYKHPVPIVINFSTVAGSAEDTAMRILFDANRVAKNKMSVNDMITLVIQYPNDKTVVLTGGFLVSGTPVMGVSGDGKLKDSQWSCVFESKVA